MKFAHLIRRVLEQQGSLEKVYMFEPAGVFPARH